MLRMKKYVVTPVHSPTGSQERRSNNLVVEPTLGSPSISTLSAHTLSSSDPQRLEQGRPEDPHHSLDTNEDDLRLTSLTYENLELKETTQDGSESIGKDNAYYEEVAFRGGAVVPSNTTKEIIEVNGEDDVGNRDDDDDDDYEEVIVDSSNDPPNYANLHRRSSPSSEGRSSGRNSRTSLASDAIESVYGMARRFPSIRMNSTASRRRKKMISEQFPRSTANEIIPLSFVSLEQLYARPSSKGSKLSSAESDRRKKSNTIVPVVTPAAPVDTAAPVAAESGSCAVPVTAIYAKRPSIASIKDSVRQKINSSLLSLKRGGHGSEISQVRETGSEVVEDKKDSEAPLLMCCCSKQSSDTLNPARRCAEEDPSHSPRRKRVTTSVLCGIIALSVIAFIIAGGVLFYHYFSGDVITVQGGSKKIWPRPNASTNSFPPSSISIPNQTGSPALSTNFQSGHNSQAGLTQWGSWSDWSSCSVECLPKELQGRSRACLDAEGNTLNDLKPCVQQGGSHMETRPCMCNPSPEALSLVRQKSSLEFSSASSIRYCDSCTSSEVCVALTGDYFPTCRDAADPEDPTGCAGLCAVDTQVCHRLDRDAFRCRNACPTGYFTCRFEDLCLEWTKVCDGNSDCASGADEVGCDGTKAGALHRSSVRESRRSTEDPVQCEGGQLMCDDGRTCLRAELFCNGHYDCPDSSDEVQGCI